MQAMQEVLQRQRAMRVSSGPGERGGTSHEAILAISEGTRPTPQRRLFAVVRRSVRRQQFFAPASACVRMLQGAQREESRRSRQRRQRCARQRRCVRVKRQRSACLVPSPVYTPPLAAGSRSTARGARQRWRRAYAVLLTVRQAFDSSAMFHAPRRRHVRPPRCPRPA